MMLSDVSRKWVMELCNQLQSRVDFSFQRTFITSFHLAKFARHSSNKENGATKENPNLEESNMRKLQYHMIFTLNIRQGANLLKDPGRHC